MDAIASGERLELAKLAARRTGRIAAARFLRSTALRPWLSPSAANELLILPPDLRTADPSFLVEIAAHQFGLAGSVANLGGLSPFVLPPPSEAWSRELHGFGWLRHLRVSASDEDAQQAAQAFALSWIELNRQPGDIAYEPAVIARRIISWISHADLLLEDCGTRTYEAIADSLGAQIQFLSATRRAAPPGHPHLLCLTALLFAALCVEGHDRRLERAQKLFIAELNRQILPDGGHASRNPDDVLELLLDILPLRQCYAARHMEPPAALPAAIRRMITFLKYVRRGDGALARFNGMGCTKSDALATVLGYEEPESAHITAAPHSRYQRLQRGKTVLIADIGGPPALPLSERAHAGCLSFEMTVGKQALLLNGGAPGPGYDRQTAAARATASHNTLCLQTTSSSRLARSRGRPAGLGPLRLPAHVTLDLHEDAEAVVIEASHDGYLEQFGLLHSRCLTLSADGLRLDGIDQLGPPHGILRTHHDIPFAIHFHVPSDAICSFADSTDVVEIRAAQNTVWHFTASGARISVEESTDYAHFSGPHRAMQIVLRGACPGETTVVWSLEEAAPAAEAASAAAAIA